MRALIIFTLLLGTSFVSIAQIIHVPTEQPTIQDGLNAASFGDTVLVAPGTYFENITWPNVNGIKLIAGGDTSDTFIDGSTTERVIHIQGHTIDTLTVIEGFTIQNGRGIGIYSGSGILCDSSAVRVNSCRLTNNSGSNGSGMAFLNSNSIVEYSTIDNNKGTWTMNSGTGMLAVNHSEIFVRNCKVVNNTSPFDLWKAFGVGLNIQSGSKVHVFNSDISHNHVSFSESGESRGIGIYMNGLSELYMYDCTVNHNVSASPVEWNRGTAINVESAAKIIFENVEIKDNVAEHATENSTGIVAINCTNTEFENVVIEQNILKLRPNEENANRGFLVTNGNFTANSLIIRDNEFITQDSPMQLRGGAIDVGGSGQFELINSLIVGNDINAHLSGNTYDATIKFNETGLANITNTTIADNFNNAEGNNISSTIDAGTTNLSIVNSILWNPNIETELSGENLDVSHSDIQDGFAGFNTIDASPMFIGNGDYRLQTLSPCINSGTIATAPDTDIDGNPRPMPIGTNPDMGAYEDDNPSTSILETTDPEDLSIYPNPTNGFVQISLEVETESVQVFSTIGMLVAEFTKNEKKIDLSDLPNGIYSLMVTSEKRKFTEKLVLSK